MKSKKNSNNDNVNDEKSAINYVWEIKNESFESYFLHESTTMCYLQQQHLNNYK